MTKTVGRLSGLPAARIGDETKVSITRAEHSSAIGLRALHWASHPTICSTQATLLNGKLQVTLRRKAPTYWMRQDNCCRDNLGAHDAVWHTPSGSSIRKLVAN